MRSPAGPQVRVHSRALRAAQIACGLAACACSTAPVAMDAGSDAVPLTDAFADPDAARSDAGEDEEHRDAYVDGSFAGDADCRDPIPADRVCCELGGGEWYVYDGGFAECFPPVPGPFVPPSEGRFG